MTVDLAVPYAVLDCVPALTELSLWSWISLMLQIVSNRLCSSPVHRQRGLLVGGNRLQDKARPLQSGGTTAVPVSFH